MNSCGQGLNLIMNKPSFCYLIVPPISFSVVYILNSQALWFELTLIPHSSSSALTRPVWAPIFYSWWVSAKISSPTSRCHCPTPSFPYQNWPTTNPKDYGQYGHLYNRQNYLSSTMTPKEAPQFTLFNFIYVVKLVALRVIPRLLLGRLTSIGSMIKRFNFERNWCTIYYWYLTIRGSANIVEILCFTMLW